MRIAYGIFGYGRGHATRALALLPELRRRHEVTIFAGGDAAEALAPHFPVIRIPTLNYVYGTDGRRSMGGTLRANAAHFADVVLGGDSVKEVARALIDARVELAICDAEPWTHTACARLNIPRISFDHFGIMAFCKPRLSALDQALSARDVLTYRLLVGQPDRVIVSSFYNAPVRYPWVRVIPPLLREQVHRFRATRGDHLLVYLNRGRYQLQPRIEAALDALGMPVLVYGSGRTGTSGNLIFRAPADHPFLEDLASCRAVVSTAGNQLVGEAMHYGKPMLVMPENSVEQRMNALAIAEMGIGEQVAHARFDAGVLVRFLRRLDSYAQKTVSLRRDGRAEAMAMLETFAAELGAMPHRPVMAPAFGAWRAAS